MGDSLQTISRFLSELPLFGGEPISVAPAPGGDGEARYIVSWPRGRAVLKVYTDTLGTSPLERARYRAAAEAEGLRLFSGQGFAPELLWHGSLPDAHAASAVLVQQLEGEPVGTDWLSAEEVELYAAALKEIHTSPHAPKLVSSTPRNLEHWWTRTYDTYRETAPAIDANMPSIVAQAIHDLVHPVSADVQTHKRFWSGAALAPVNGTPGQENLLFRGGRLTLLEWQRFGMGDPAFEVAAASDLVGLWSGREAGEHLIEAYLQGNEDEILPTRIELYGRVFPFGHAIAILKRVAPDRAAASVKDGTTLRKFLARALRTYERNPKERGEVKAALGRWLREGREA